MRKKISTSVKNAGVVGAGGAGFPTHVKIAADVEVVLVNGASCEPLLMSDPYLLEKEIEKVIEGLKAVLQCTGAKRGIICLKGKHVKAMASVKNAIQQDLSNQLELFELNDFYPAGDEHVLVHEVLGRTVPEAGIPLQVKVVVSNVESLYNIAFAVNNIPVTDRYLTIAGEIATPMIVKAPVGSLVSELIEFAGGTTISDYKVIDGGPMMGRVLPDIFQPITKTTSGILILPADHNVVAGKVKDPAAILRITKNECCQCTLCTDLCPRNLLGHSLHPHKLMRSYETGFNNSIEIRKEALLCSECGICEKFACPMLISPREVNSLIKKELMKEGIKWNGSNITLKSNPFREVRYIPTKRLMARLNVTKYDCHPDFSKVRFKPSKLMILLNQHIGAMALPVVKAGDQVKRGDLIGEIPDNALGARLHAGMEGKVASIDKGVVTIVK